MLTSLDLPQGTDFGDGSFEVGDAFLNEVLGISCKIQELWTECVIVFSFDFAL